MVTVLWSKLFQFGAHATIIGALFMDEVDRRAREDHGPWMRSRRLGIHLRYGRL
jgi:hypothetical protein